MPDFALIIPSPPDLRHLRCILWVPVLVLLTGPSSAEVFNCDFTEPSCAWTWSEELLLVSIENSTSLGITAPQADAHNDTKGQFLYYSPKSTGEKVTLEVVSPQFKPGTKGTCALVFYAHMYNMDNGYFKTVITVTNSSWETPSPSYVGDSKHSWEIHRHPIGAQSQPFNVILEFIVHSTVFPSHIAISDVKTDGCYEANVTTTECQPRHFVCDDQLCIDESRVCDITEDCAEGEDEEQGCGKLPESAYCSFEKGTCGWNITGWERVQGKKPRRQSGPEFDHTFKNSSGSYMMTTFRKAHRFGASAQMTSPIFPAPPYYHVNPYSQYFNSCTVRFFYHKYGRGGDLTLESILVDRGSKSKSEILWREYGNKGNNWLQATVAVRNITSRYYLQFVAIKAIGHDNIAIDDITLSPQCFGIGVPLNETIRPPHTTSVSNPQGSITNDSETELLKFEFSTCGAKGRFGPNETMCSTVYLNTPTSIVMGTEYGMEGTQKWIVPSDGLYTVIVNGAGGGHGINNTQESFGSLIRGTFNWSAGETIYILVGQQGKSACSGENFQYGNAVCETHNARRLRRGIHNLQNVSKVYELRRTSSKIHDIQKIAQKRQDGGGGGGGGASAVYKIDNDTKIPLILAAGGGGISAEIPKNTSDVIDPHGRGVSISILPGNGHSGSSSGGGGGWNDTTSSGISGMEGDQNNAGKSNETRRSIFDIRSMLDGIPRSIDFRNDTTDIRSAGKSLVKGGQGGDVCRKAANVWNTQGGFGGGGGGCGSGGGGGGYRGGDAAAIESNMINGQGGVSYLTDDAVFPLVAPGSNDGDGSVMIIPAQIGCGCEYLCVLLDEERKDYFCTCPEGLTLNIDGHSCNGYPVLPEPALSGRQLIILVVGIMVAIAIITFLALFGLVKYRKSQMRDQSQEALNTPEAQLSQIRRDGGMVTEYNPNYEFGGSTCTVQDLREIPREQLTLVKALGQGAFGEVYQGYLTNPTERPVAVKTLPELSAGQAEMDFLMEALIMSKFNHPNIVSFIGVCFEKLPRFIILELLPGGDMKSFLRECRPNPQRPSPLTVTDLLMLAIDVAKGCQYLEENHFIHRDIAARNCLLTTKDVGRVVKIADFGMARDIYRADYYRKGGKAMLPVKWMPPEAFLDGIFTSKTDVWSFGVLLWEVISLGYMPYPGTGNQEVMQLVTSGGRLEPPTNCPSPVYHIMMQCWHPLPDERPNFITILERLGYCLQDPDVINAPLPVFNRAPSMERDATVMRPADADNGGCLRVQRPDPSLLSPGSEDYLIPMPQSTYSITTERTDLQSSPSMGSVDQLLELEDRGSGVETPSSVPSTWETNFMTPDTPTDGPVSHWNDLNNPVNRSPNPKHCDTANFNNNLKKRPGGYHEVPTEDDELPNDDRSKKVERSTSAASQKQLARNSSLKSLEDLPVAPSVTNANEEGCDQIKPPRSVMNNHSSLSLDPSALTPHIGQNMPRRYMNVDVNFNTGDGSGTSPLSTRSENSQYDQNTANRNVGPFDGYAGVNPVA